MDPLRPPTPPPPGATIPRLPAIDLEATSEATDSLPTARTSDAEDVRDELEELAAKADEAAGADDGDDASAAEEEQGAAYAEIRTTPFARDLDAADGTSDGSQADAASVTPVFEAERSMLEEQVDPGDAATPGEDDAPLATRLREAREAEAEEAAIAHAIEQQERMAYIENAATIAAGNAVTSAAIVQAALTAEPGAPAPIVAGTAPIAPLAAITDRTPVDAGALVGDVGDALLRALAPDAPEPPDGPVAADPSMLAEHVEEGVAHVRPGPIDPDDPAVELREGQTSSGDHDDRAATIAEAEERIDAEREQAQLAFGVANAVAAGTVRGAVATGGTSGAIGAAGAADDIVTGGVTASGPIGSTGVGQFVNKAAGPVAGGDSPTGSPSLEEGRTRVEDEYDPALMRRVTGYAPEGVKGMPTIGRDQLNTGETVDPAFEDASAASGDAATAPPVDDDLAGSDATAEAEKPTDVEGGTETPDIPRMDDLVDDESRTSGIRNRVDALTEHEVDLPDAAREHMGVPSGMRGDNPDEEPFRAPREWGGAGAENAAETAAGASDAGEGRGGGRPGAATNGTSHPSDHGRADDEADGVLRPDDEPRADDHAPDFGAGAGDEHGRGEEHGREEGHGRGGDRDEEDVEPLA